MKKLIMSILINSAVTYCVYEGVNHNEPLMNVALFITWAFAVIHIGYYSESVLEEVGKMDGIETRLRVGAAFDLLIAVMYAYGGYFATAGAAFFMFITILSVTEKIKKD